MICSSKKVADQKIKDLNERYDEWCKFKVDLYEKKCNSTDYIKFVYNNPQPSKYRIEKLEITK